MSDSPTLPERIADLQELATDLWWVWHRDAREVFRRLDYKVWRLTAHNPVRMLRLVSPERFAAVAADPSYLALFDGVMAQLQAARTGDHTWWSARTTLGRDRPDCLLLRRVRDPPVAADLRRRPGRARR